MALASSVSSCLRPMVAALVALLLFASAAAAAPLPGSAFEGDDGNQDAAPLATDWQSLYAAGRVIVQDDPNANDSIVNGKELNPDGWTLATEPGGALPEKANVLGAWYATEVRPTGSFIYFAFNRESPDGNSYLAFLVNQRTDTWVNGAGATIPCRTTGDILIDYSIDSGAAAVGLSRWTSSTSDPATGCARTGTYAAIPISGTNAQGAVNTTSAITNYMTPGGPTFALRTFAEGALNLSDTLGYSCERFRQIQIHSRASSGVDSALADTADPVLVDLGGCDPNIAVSGPQRIHHGEVATFTYTVTNDANTPLTNVSVSDDKCPAANMTGPVKANGNQDDLLIKGEVWTYTCAYTVTAAHAAGESDPIISTATVRTGSAGNVVSDSATHTMDVLHPAITLDQELRRGATGAYLQGPIDAHVGETAFYRFTIANPGDTPLAVTTDFPACNGGSVSGPTGDADADNSLDPDETWVYLCRHAFMSADADPFSSPATVTGTDVLGRAVNAADATTVDLLNPAIAVTGGVRRGASGPYADGTIDARTGDTLHYRYLVTNPGDTPLDVSVTDPRCDAGTLGRTGGDADGDGRLDPAETWVYTCTHAVVASDGDPLENRLTATGTDSLGLARTAASTETANLLHPAVTVDKELRLDPSGAWSQGPIEVHRGDRIGYRFTIVNTGDTPVSVSASDPVCDAGTLSGPAGDADGDGRLGLSETWTYTCSRVVAATDPDPLPNRVDVTATDVLGTQATASDTAWADVLTPGIAVDKTLRRGASGPYAQGPIQARTGDTLHYRFAVTNTSDSPLAVTLTDARCAAGTLSPPSGDADADDRLDVTETWVYTCRRTLTADDEDPFVNQVTVTGRDSLGGESTAIDSASADVLHPDVVVDSGVRIGGVGPYADSGDAHVGDTATYRFTVTNPGDAELSVAVSPLRCDAGTLSGPLGDTDGDGRLDPAETWTYTCTHVIASSDADPFVARVDVTATDALGGTAAAFDISTVDVLHPAITLVQQLRRGTAAFGDGPVDAHAGDTLDYRFTVTNPGDTPLGVALTAPRCDAGTIGAPTGDADGDLLLDPAETWTYSCSRVVRADDPDPLGHSASVTGTDKLGGTATAADATSADVLHPALTIDTQVDRAQAHTGDELDYTLTVVNTGDTPLDVTLADPRCDAGTLAPAGGKLGVGETLVAGCTHVLGAGDPDPFVNTATATGVDALGRSVSDDDSATADVLHPQVSLDVLVRRGATGTFGQGPVDARVGDDLEYRFLVTNPGDAPLTVDLSASECAPGSFAGDSDGDSRLDPDETWTATCTRRLAASDADPFTNDAAVTGTDAIGGTGTDSDSATANVLAPGLTVDAAARRGAAGPFSAGPVDAHAGDTVTYRFTVANAGETALAVDLDTTRCDGGTLTAPTGDTDGDGRLDTTETWSYDCTRVVTAADGDPFANVATATGTDSLGGTATATDAVSVDVLHPALTVDHEIRRGGTGTYAQGPVDAHRGDTLGYRFTVTNAGDTALDVTLDAARCDAGTLTGPTGSLATGATATYTCTNQIAAGDPDPLTSTATATGTDTLGGTATASDAATADLLHGVVTVDAEVRRSAADPYAQSLVDAHRGDTLDYRFTVTNGGDAALSVTLDVPRCDAGTLSAPAGDADGDGRLDVTETWTFTCTRVIAAGDPDPLVATVTATGTDALDGTDEASDSVEVDVLHPGIALAHEIRRDGAYSAGPVDAHRGDTLTHRLTAANTGDAPLAVALSAPMCDAGTLSGRAGDADGDDRLDLSETWTWTCTHRVADGDADPLSATASVTGTDALGGTSTASDTAIADVLEPSVTVEHTTSPQTLHRGDTLTHTFTVANSGDTPLATALDAPRCDPGTLAEPTGDTDADGRLDESEQWVYTCADAVTAGDPDPLVSTVTVTGTDSLGGTATASDDAAADVLHPELALDVTLRRGSTGAFGDGPIDVRLTDTITYRFAVANRGDAPLAVALDEPGCDAGTLSAPAGDADGDDRLDVSETWTFTCTREVTVGGGDPLTTASTATGTDPLGRAVTSQDATVANVIAPAITVRSTQRRGNAGAFTAEPIEAHVGDVLQYEFAVANTGDTPVVPEPVNPGCDAGTIVLAGGDADGDGRLDLDETWRYGCRHEVADSDAEPFPNRMRVTATDSLGATASAEDSVRAHILKPAVSVAESVSSDGASWTHEPVEIPVGSPVHYRFSVTNQGNVALAVTIGTDRCDAGTLAKVAGDPNGDGMLDTRETWTYRCRYLTSTQDPAEFANEVTVTGRDHLGGEVTGGDSRLARLRAVADLELRKTGPASVAAGGDIAFTLVAVNHGPSTARQVVVRDTLPPGLTLRAATPVQGECSASGAVVECALGTLASGASASISVVATTSPEQAGTSVTNTASVSSAAVDPDPADDTASATVAVESSAPPPAADLVIDKSLLTAADRVGDELTYLITVVNDGPGAAHGVRVDDTLSNAVRFVSATASQGTCSGAPALRCEIGEIADGQKVTLRIVVVPLRVGALTNRAVVSAAETDPDLENNSSAVTRRIRPQATVQSLRKRADRRRARSGEVVTFTITYRNRGRAAARRVRVCDRLPAQLSFVSAPGARLRGGRACWTRSRVSAGRALRFKVRARVEAAVAARAVNVATATATNAPAARARAAVRVSSAPRPGGVTG